MNSEGYEIQPVYRVQCSKSNDVLQPNCHIPETLAVKDCLGSEGKFMMGHFHIASYNLYQFAEPGTFWYEADETNDYEPAQWAEKLGFIRARLAEMEAAVIGFQEVFSVDAFRALLEAEGYEVRILRPTSFETGPNGETIWKGPNLALASRFPIRSARILTPTPAIEPDGLLSPEFDYRRGVIEAEIELPFLAEPLLVYNCHFKSQGTFVDKNAVAAEPDWSARFRSHLRQSALLDANQVIRRAGEAMMLYEHVMNRIAANPARPIVVLGDLNDEPGSFTLRILTQNERIRHIGGRSYVHLEATERAQRYTWQLYSAAGLAPMQDRADIPTHVGWSQSSVLDYILVSNALNPRNPNALGSVGEYQVFNQHHLDRVDPLLSSDHAPLRARIDIGPV